MGSMKLKNSRFLVPTSWMDEKSGRDVSITSVFGRMVDARLTEVSLDVSVVSVNWLSVVVVTGTVDIFADSIAETIKVASRLRKILSVRVVLIVVSFIQAS